MKKPVTKVERIEQDSMIFYRLFGDEGLILDAKEGHKVFLNRPGQAARLFEFPVEDVRVGDVLRTLGDIHR